jgi:hypothetical protein
MSIYFKPTWLYIKQHNLTKLKYFGKTINKDPVKYKGSGKHWTRHINKYGNDVTTVWCQLFTDKNELKEFALKFSVDNNIVESVEWANLKPEDGLWGGGIKGIKIKRTPEHNKKISQSIRKKLIEQGRIPKPPKEKKEDLRVGGNGVMKINLNCLLNVWAELRGIKDCVKAIDL